MATLAHARSGFGRADGASTAAEVLDRAIALAASRHPRPRGLLGRLFVARRTPAALVRRHRLRGAIDAAYGRIVRELGPVRVEMSAEESAGEEYLAMDCFTAHPDLDRVIEVEDAVQRQVHATLGDRWLRLLVSVNPGTTDADSA